MPDFTVIMTDLTQECRWDNKTNYKYSFDYVEYAGCYLNPDNKSDPEADGEYLWYKDSECCGFVLVWMNEYKDL